MLAILGLPAHIMFLHAVVAFARVAGVAGIVYALRPSWQRVLEWPVAVLAVLTAALTVLTASAGEALEEAMPSSELIGAHAEQGDRLEPVAGAFAVIVVLTVTATGPWITSQMPFLARARSARWLGWGLQTLTVLAGLVLIYQVVITGHSGPKRSGQTGAPTDTPRSADHPRVSRERVSREVFFNEDFREGLR
jgi:hypothetical protein